VAVKAPTSKPDRTIGPIARNLLALTTAAGVRRPRDFDRVFGISPETARRWYSGRSEPSEANIARCLPELSKRLGRNVSAAEIVGEVVR
jgi:hypothetical protein